MLKFIVTLALILSSLLSFGQGVPNVEFMSDSQIEQYWIRAQDEGYELGEIKNIAISRGMSQEQAELLVSRIRDLSGLEGASEIQSTTLRSASSGDGLDSFLSGDEDELNLTPFERKLFGYKIFQAKGLSFNPNLNMPTPKSYILGPGDQLEIEIFGSSQASYDLSLNAQGAVKISRVGPVQLSGLSIQAAEQKLLRSLSKLHRGLLGTKPTDFMEITLGDIRTMKINIVGEVKKPGVYAIPSFANPFNVIYAAGGPTTKGTFREIKIYRAGRLVQNVDLYEYLTTGAFTDFGGLLDEDIIVVGPYSRRIEASGSFKLPGIFELSEKETIVDLIEMAGGFESGAITKSVTLERLKGEKQLVKDLSPLDNTFLILDGDAILARQAVDPLIERVQIEGAVLNPASYGWQKGLTVTSLIEKAGGLLPGAYDSQVSLFRRKKDLSTELIAIDLSIEGTKDFKVQVGDLFFIPSKFELKETQFIEIEGAVIEPGVLPFIDGMTAADALILASGLENKAHGGQLELVSDPENPGSDFKISSFSLASELDIYTNESLQVRLRPYDRLFIRQASGFIEPSYVQVSGEINAPGKYLLETRETKVGDILKRANGLTPYAFPKGAYIMRRSGEQNKMNDSKVKLARLERLSGFLNRRLQGSALTPVERTSINQRLLSINGRYEDLLRNSGLYTSEDTLQVALDSILIDKQFKYDKIAIATGREDGFVSNNLNLKDGDIIIVPTLPQTVKISGQVLTGEKVTRYVSNRNLKSYIGEAGGFTLTAKKSKAYVVYADGSAQRTRNFLFFKNRPKVRPGAEIVVPGGRTRESFNIDRIFGLISTTATTYFIILSIQDSLRN